MSLPARLTFEVFDDEGVSKNDATPTLVMLDRTGSPRPALPAIANHHDGSYSFQPTEQDEALGTLYLVTTGAQPSWVYGSICSDRSQFVAMLLDDGVDLWTGDPPVVDPAGPSGQPAYTDLLGTPRTAPPVMAVAGAYLYALTPSIDDLAVGTRFRVKGPDGASVPYFYGQFSVNGRGSTTSVGEAIYAELVADAGVTSLVAKRIFPGQVPEGSAMPAVCYSVISDLPQDSLEGGIDRLKNARLQVDCYAKTYLEAHAVAASVAAVIAALSRPDLSCVEEIARDLYDNTAELHRVSTDFGIWR